MGLENLKSIFTEGMSKFNNTNVTDMTSNYGPGGIFSQPDAFSDKILFQKNFQELMIKIIFTKVFPRLP